MRIQRSQLTIIVATLAVVFSMLGPSIANAADSRLQIFIEIEGSVPDWTELELTATTLHVSGFLTNGDPFPLRHSKARANWLYQAKMPAPPGSLLMVISPLDRLIKLI